MKRFVLGSSLAAAIAAAPLPAWPADGPAAAPPAPGGHGASAAPIDCPLHGGGVDASKLRPFAETEKYIAFLERPDRAAWQKPDEVVRALRLRGGETVADVGAGSGYFTFRLARALPGGKVIATDIDPEMVRHVHHQVMSKRIRNVTAVLTGPDDPAIAREADVVFIADVLHHVANREPWLRRAYVEMKPGARLVVIEFKDGALPEGPPESLKIPKAELVSTIERAGFHLLRDEPELLPYQTFLTFEKPRTRR
jgi:SAM-dependent methyltransferase